MRVRNFKRGRPTTIALLKVTTWPRRRWFSATQLTQIRCRGRFIPMLTQIVHPHKSNDVQVKRDCVMSNSTSESIVTSSLKNNAILQPESIQIPSFKILPLDTIPLLQADSNFVHSLSQMLSKARHQPSRPLLKKHPAAYPS